MYSKVGMVSSLSVLIILVLTALPAHATKITWNFDSPTGPLGTTQNYTVNGITITAHGFNFSNTPVDMFGINRGGDEFGLGLQDDPSGEDEIAVGAGYVQLDITNVLNAHIKGGMQVIASVQPGESYNVFGSNTLGSLGTLLISNGKLDATRFNLPDFGSFKFYGFTAGTGNVLVSSVSGSTPEPGTIYMFAVALMVATPFALNRRDSRVS